MTVPNSAFNHVGQCVTDLDRSKRIAQRELARVMTAWVHGTSAIANIESAGQAVRGTLAGMTDAMLLEAAGAAPRVDIPRSELEAGMPIIDLLARTVADSKNGARRLLTQGGVYLNNVKITEVDRKITLADLATETMFVVGTKKDRWLVRAV